MADSMAMSPYRAMSAMDVARGAIQKLAEERSVVPVVEGLFASGASTFVFAWMNGRYQNPKLAGIASYDLVGAAVLHGLAGLAGYLLRSSPSSLVRHGVRMGHAAGTGAFSSYIAKIGAGMGVDARSKAPAPEAVKGYVGAYSHMPGTSGVGALSADEAARYVK